MRRFYKWITGRFFDWISGNIQAIFVQWVIVTTFETASFINLFGGVLGSQGFREVINSVWNHASLAGDITWWFDTGFYGLSFVINKFHKVRKKYDIKLK